MTKKFLKSAEIGKTAWAMMWSRRASIILILKFVILASKFQQVEDSGFWWRVEQKAVNRMFLWGNFRSLILKAWRAR